MKAIRSWTVVLGVVVLAASAAAEELPYPPPGGGGGTTPTWGRMSGNLYAHPATVKVAIGSTDFRSKLNIEAGQTDWMTFSRSVDTAYWRVWNSDGASEQISFAYAYTNGTTRWGILKMNSDGRVGLSGDLENSHGTLVIGGGHNDWINLENSGGALWRFHNPPGANRLEIGYKNPDGSHLWKIFTIQDNGNIGIGVADAPEKLTVDGKILAEEVRVLLSSDWPDYVFDEDYDLPALGEVQSFIHENGHLPGLPAADQVSRDGVPVGEMQATLLRKVEELTLYVIDLDAENRELRRRLESME